MSVAIISRFKNERHILYEWVHHHFEEGIDKILLIDDNSEDDYLEKNGWLTNYLDTNKVEIFKSVTGIQHNEYNFFLEQIKEHTWIVQIDLDEFVFCPRMNMTLKDMLKGKYKDSDYIRIRWKMFAHQDRSQPKSVIGSNIVTHSSKVDPTSPNGIKCIAKTRFLKSIRIHSCEFTKTLDAVSLLAHNEDIQINHYRTQSDEFLYGVKEQRGGGANRHGYRNIEEKMKLYLSFDKTDTVLKKKRAELIQRCMDRPQVKPLVYKNSSYALADT